MSTNRGTEIYWWGSTHEHCVMLALGSSIYWKSSVVASSPPSGAISGLWVICIRIWNNALSCVISSVNPRPLQHLDRQPWGLLKEKLFGWLLHRKAPVSDTFRYLENMVNFTLLIHDSIHYPFTVLKCRFYRMSNSKIRSAFLSAIIRSMTISIIICDFIYRLHLHFWAHISWPLAPVNSDFGKSHFSNLLKSLGNDPFGPLTTGSEEI